MIRREKFIVSVVLCVLVFVFLNVPGQAREDKDRIFPKKEDILIPHKKGSHDSLGRVMNMDNPILIDGDPLKITVFDDSTMGVQWNQSGTFYHQFYAAYSKGSVIFMNGSDLSYRWGGGDITHSMYSSDLDRFTPVSHTSLDAWTVQTVYDVGTTGVQITQNISYINGNSYYKFLWEITNNGATTFNDIRFIHGGDTYFANFDSSEGHWSSDLRMVYLTNQTQGIAGIMGFYGGVSTPADHYFEEMFWTNANAAFLGNHLPDTVRSDYHDAGYTLEWDRSTLAPGETWTIEAFEKWTEAGDVQVFAPPEQTGNAGTTMNLQFVVFNFQQQGTDIFDLSVNSANGWTTNLPGGNTITLNSNSSGTVDVQLTIPSGVSPGSTDHVTLTATSQTTPGVTNSDGVTVHVAGQSVVEYILNLDIDSMGGTINPGVGNFRFNEGTFAVVTATPEQNYEFCGWSGDILTGQENDNPLRVKMNSDKSITAHFCRILYCVLNPSGSRILNRSLSQAEYIDVLNWEGNPDNVNISMYRIYQVENGSSTLLAEVTVGNFTYENRNVDTNKTYTYEIVPVNNEGREGCRSTVIVQ